MKQKFEQLTFISKVVAEKKSIWRLEFHDFY